MLCLVLVKRFYFNLGYLFAYFVVTCKIVLVMTYILLLLFGQETGPKFGTMMGVFVPCLQNILGIIYYIRFTW
jgi:hypothetical protein